MVVNGYCWCVKPKINNSKQELFKDYIIVMLGLGFVFTDGVKCITLLVFVALVGKSGRSYLRALCFAYVIAGPIENLASNVGEVVRVFSCSTILTYNLTRTRFDLMTKPFQRTVYHMKEDIKEVQNTFNDLRNVTNAVHQEIMGEDPVTTTPPLSPITVANVNQTSSTTQFSKMMFTTSAPINIGLENESSGKNFSAIDTAFYTTSDSLNDTFLFPATTSKPVQFTLVPVPVNESDPYSNITAIIAGLHSTIKPINTSVPASSTDSVPVESSSLNSSARPINIPATSNDTSSKPIQNSSISEPNKSDSPTSNYDVLKPIASAPYLQLGKILKSGKFSFVPKKKITRRTPQPMKNKIEPFRKASTTLKPSRFSTIFKGRNHAPSFLKVKTFSSNEENRRKSGGKITTESILATDRIYSQKPFLSVVNKDNDVDSFLNPTQFPSFLTEDNNKIKPFTTSTDLEFSSLPKIVDDLNPFLSPTQFPFFLLKDKPPTRQANVPDTTAQPNIISSIPKENDDRDQLGIPHQFHLLPIKCKLPEDEADASDIHDDKMSKSLNIFSPPRTNGGGDFFANPMWLPLFLIKNKPLQQMERDPIMTVETTTKQITYFPVSKGSDDLDSFVNINQVPSFPANDKAIETEDPVLSAQSTSNGRKFSSLSKDDDDFNEFLNPTQFPLFVTKKKTGKRSDSVRGALEPKDFFLNSKNGQGQESFLKRTHYLQPLMIPDTLSKHFVKRDVQSDAEYSQEDDNFDDFSNTTQAPLVLMKEKFEESAGFDSIASVGSEFSTLSEDESDVKSFSNRTEPLSKGFVDSGLLPNAEYTQEKYKNKMKKRCIQQLDNGKDRCRQTFANSLQRCRDKMPFILKTLLCWPFKADFICNINFLGNPDSICDPSDAIPNNFGEAYADLADTENKLYTNGSDVSVSYKVISLESSPELQSAKETADAVMQEFNLKKRLFNAILRQLQRVLAFMILRVLWACVQYHSKYKKDVDFDNIYVTEYFKHVDERRLKEGKNPLLPLKKYERKNLVDTTEGWGRTKEEKRDIGYHLFQFFVEIFSGFFFLFLDHTIVVLLQIVREHSEIHFLQEGEHTIKFYVSKRFICIADNTINGKTPTSSFRGGFFFSTSRKIEGSGLIARLLRTTMHNFNMHETVHTELSNKQCLPNPNVLPSSFYYKLFSLYAIILILIYQSTAFLRLRRATCSYFYRKREKSRVLYLYNTLMKQRRILIKTMIKKAKLNSVNRRVRQQANLFLKLRFMYPRYFGWLKKFKVGRRKCVICDEFEDHSVVVCGNLQCGVCYCHECWSDMDRECLVCNGLISQDVIINFEEFFEEFIFE
ncbi:LOW QUALITY PROTEIN: ubiquitin protein ligase sneaky [Glossina fuscipes fuscipes]